METTRDRVISISLNEQEWLAFVEKHPQPVTWLRERIKESIGVDVSSISSQPPAAAAANTTSATRQ